MREQETMRTIQILDRNSKFKVEEMIVVEENFMKILKNNSQEDEMKWNEKAEVGVCKKEK